jgi:hypothetical protein
MNNLILTIMRKSILFRAMAVASMFAIATFSVNAQYTTVPTDAAYDGTGTSDYVTIGSRVPYYVQPDAGIVTLVGLGAMNASQFGWEFLDATATAAIAPALTVLNYNGTGAAAGGAADFYVGNEISVVWDAASVAAGTQYTVRATEHSMPTSGVFADGCSDATPELRTVWVIDRPTIDFQAASSSACGITPGAGVQYFVPIDVTGLGDWDISFDVTYNGAAYLAAQTYTAGTATAVANDAALLGAASAVKSLNGTPTADVDGLEVIINGATAANGFGRYDVTVTNITDRISRKSLDMTLVAAQVADLPAAAYTIWVMPTPVTAPIRHRSNLTF